jgi:MFS family permease
MGNDVVNEGFTAKEKRFILGISFILGMRQFGMMLVTPFISVYGKELIGGTAATVGIALGAYGLTQAIFQIPYGFISDRFGRKPVVLFGIAIQFAGFIAALYAKSIPMFIVARALQGSGAINSVSLSWTADVIDSNKINKTMGIISTVNSISIALSLIGGVFLQKILTIPQIFLLCAIISIGSLIDVLFGLKEDKRGNLKLEDSKYQKNKYPINIVFNRRLVRLYATGFISNFMLMAAFYILPLVSDEVYGKGGLWKVFISALVIVFFAIKLVSKYSDKDKERILQMTIFSCFAVSVPCLFSGNWFLVSVGTIIYFNGVMCQYAVINSVINIIADKRYRGSINGICNMTQFLGSFTGGTATGSFWGIGKEACMIMLLTVCIIGIIVSSISSNNKENKVI